VIALQLTVCQSGGGGGGPSTFGYDASSACSKPYSRAGRAHHDLPCDFRRQNWCTIAGSSYPWYFVHLCFVSSALVIDIPWTFACPHLYTHTCANSLRRKFRHDLSSHEVNILRWIEWILNLKFVSKIRKQWSIVKSLFPLSLFRFIADMKEDFTLIYLLIYFQRVI